jgi:hypothetical protein
VNAAADARTGSDVGISSSRPRAVPQQCAWLSRARACVIVMILVRGFSRSCARLYLQPAEVLAVEAPLKDQKPVLEHERCLLLRARARRSDCRHGQSDARALGSNSQRENSERRKAGGQHVRTSLAISGAHRRGFGRGERLVASCFSVVAAW